MKAVSGKRMCKVLEGKGWTLDRINGSHHIYESPAGIHVSVSVYANRDLRPGTQRSIMRAAGLTDQDL